MSHHIQIPSINVEMMSVCLESIKRVKLCVCHKGVRVYLVELRYHLREGNTDNDHEDDVLIPIIFICLYMHNEKQK